MSIDSGRPTRGFRTRTGRAWRIGKSTHLSSVPSNPFASTDCNHMRPHDNFGYQLSELWGEVFCELSPANGIPGCESHSTLQMLVRNPADAFPIQHMG